MDDNDQVIFYPNQGVDPHNRCCGGSMWCIQVINYVIDFYYRLLHAHTQTHICITVFTYISNFFFF